jgi:hypothetical protein
VAPAPQVAANDDDDDEDRELAIPVATGSASHRVFGQGSQSGIPKNAFGKPEDEITSDFKLPDGSKSDVERPRSLRASQQPVKGEVVTQPLPTWQPLSDDEGTGEALIESLRKTSENTPEGERGPGRPGLN